MARPRFPRRRNPIQAAATSQCESLEPRTLLAADLIATILPPVPAALAPLGNTLSVKITNQGDSPAIASAVQTTLTFSKVSDPLTTTILTPAHSSRNINLAPGASLTLVLKFDVPSNLTDGDYIVYATADATNVVAESDETNNASAPIDVQVTAPFVDLSGAFGPVTAKPVKIGKNGGAYVATLVLRNNGNVAIKADTAVQLFISTDAIVGNGDDANAGSVKLKGLRIPANKSKTLHLRLKLIGTLDNGTYFLIAITDPANSIVESDETNNIAISATPLSLVNTALPPGIAAVTVDSAAITNNQPAPINFGSSLQNLTGATKTFTITNTGPRNLKLGTITTPTGFQLLDDPPGSLAPGETDTFTVQMLTTGAAGPQSGRITIATSNPKQNPFTFKVTGALAAATTPTLDSILQVDTNSLLVGQADEVAFTANVAGTNAGLGAEVDETDANGTILNKVVDLFDDGSLLHGDATAGDGIFNNSTAIQFNAPGDRFFIARLSDGSQQTAVTKISGFNAPTSDQLQATSDNDAAQKDQAVADIQAGKTDGDILAGIKTRLLTMPDQADPNSISISASSIGWTSPQGVRSIIDLTDLRDDLAATSTAQTSPTPATSASLVAGPTLYAPGTCTNCGGGANPMQTAIAQALASSPVSTPISAALSAEIQQCKQATLIAPYAWRSGTSVQRFAADLAPKGWNIISPQNTSKTMQNVTLDTFSQLSSSKLIVISSDIVLDGMTQWLLTGQDVGITTDIAHLGDYISGRISDINGVYAISRRFISHYGGSFKDAIIYAEGSNTAFNDQFATPFLAGGAAAYLGYTRKMDYASLFGLAAADTLAAQKMVSEIPRLDDGDTVDSLTRAQFHAFGNKDAKLKDTCNLLRNEQVVVQYSWNQGEDDLDSGTTFLDGTVGFDAPALPSDNPFLTWTSGDNTGNGGTETATVDVGKAYYTGKWSSTTTISCAAGWYALAGGSGPAVITITLVDKTTGEEVKSISRKINPGKQDTLATTPVATILVTASNDTPDATAFISFG